MQVRSLSAFFAGVFGLLPVSLFFFGLLKASPADDEFVWLALIVGLLTVPFLIATAAAFLDDTPLRIACLTAALVASVPPMVALMFLFLVGIVLVPGVGLLLVATIRNTFSARSALIAVASLVIGLLAGGDLVLAWWPILGAFEGDQLSGSGVAFGFVIMGVSMAGLLFTRLIGCPGPVVAA